MNLCHKFAAITVFPLMVFVPAHAGQAGSGYAGVQYAMTTVDLVDMIEFEPSAAVGRFGYYVSENFAVEGRIGIGMGDDTYTDFVGDSMTVDASNLFGIYGVVSFPLADRASIYGLIGGTNFEIESSAVISGIPFDLGELDESGLSFGFGGEFAVGESALISAEYTSYVSSGDVFDASAISLGISVGF